MAETGIVKTFSVDDGYGWVQPDDGSADIEVSIIAVQAAGMSKLTANQRLTYEVEEQEDGTDRAVSLISDE